MKFPRTTRSEQLKILTLVPDCFTIDETAQYFSTSTRMVKLARKLKEEQGILPEVPIISKGRRITPDEVTLVHSFFENDDISRLCPGKKDFLSVKREDGTREHQQKRLILGNLREIFMKYLEDESNPRIGFSTFCSLRPKKCVLAGHGGTHSVCVCTQHQNPKLQLNAMGDKNLTLECVMRKGVCDVESEECMMGRCPACPGQPGIKHFLEQHPVMEEKEEFQFKKWRTVDRCQLEDVTESVDEFVDSLSLGITKLLRHHFVSRKQSAYFQLRKQTLTEVEGILVGDFSENYSFVVQDAAQGFHWVNSQATLHPFVFYFRDGQSIKHQSFCFFSNSTKHTTAMVHAFLKLLIPCLRRDYSRL